MKGIVLLLLTILVALCMIDKCNGHKWPWRRYWRRGLTIQGRSKYATLNKESKRALNGDIQDEDIENVDSADGHLDERYVDMNDEDVMDDIDERYVNDPQEDD